MMMIFVCLFYRHTREERHHSDLVIVISAGVCTPPGRGFPPPSDSDHRCQETAVGQASLLLQGPPCPGLQSGLQVSGSGKQLRKGPGFSTGLEPEDSD